MGLSQRSSGRSLQESPHALSLETQEASVPCGLGWQRTKMGTHPSNVGEGWVRLGGDFGWDSGLGDPGQSPSASSPSLSFSLRRTPAMPGAGCVCVGGGAGGGRRASGGAGQAWGRDIQQASSLPCTSCSGHLSGSWWGREP